MAKKILLADDSVTIQKVVELILSEGDYELKVFGNGQEAFQYIQQDKPDLVLADIEMPGLNGYQLCEKIKSDPSLKDIPVVLLSGAFEPLDESLAQQVKADDNLVKPFESSELISKIEEVLSKRPEPEEPSEGVYEISEEEIASLEGAEEEFKATEEEEVAFTAGPETEEVIIEEDQEEDLWESEFSGSEEGFAEVSVTEEEGEGLEDQPELEVEGTFEEPVTEEQPSEVTPPEVETPSYEDKPATAEVSETPTVSISTEQIERSLKEGIDRVFQQIDASVRDMIQDSISKIDLQSNINDIIQSQLSQHLERLILEKLPPAIEEGIKTTVENLSGELKTEIERILWETVPDLAETIITKEIEKIKAKY